MGQILSLFLQKKQLSTLKILVQFTFLIKILCNFNKETTEASNHSKVDWF